jgi:hypothetical protein
MYVFEEELGDDSVVALFKEYVSLKFLFKKEVLL